jgi:hypothetical protein
LETSRPALVLPVAGLAALLLIAVGAWWLWNEEPAVEPAPPPIESAPPAPSTQPASGEVPAPDGADGAATQPPVTTVAPPKPGKVTFPDGSMVDAVNGVTVDVTMQWDDRPFSPIVNIVTYHGCEWWVHADGAYSTVQMNTVNGVPQPITQVARVGEEPPVPTIDEARKRAREQQPKQSGQ